MENHSEWVRLLNVLVVDKLQHLYLILLFVVVPNNAWQPLLASMELVGQQRFLNMSAGFSVPKIFSTKVATLAMRPTVHHKPLGVEGRLILLS